MIKYGLSKEFVFQDAVDFLESKEALPADVYKKLEADARSRAFTVSGYTSGEILNAFLEKLSDAVAEGLSKKQFQDNMNEFLEKNGYVGVDARHADVIFRTNIQTAYMAGHYENMKEAKAFRPYWQYKTAGDGEVRDSHLAMEGKVYAADDPIWDIWYPPNGYRCRCMVVSLTKSQVESRGIVISKTPPQNLVNGEVVFPDRGFSNNPAKTSWHPDMRNITPELKRLIQARKQKKV